jgi:hypothetical protein
MLRALSLSYDLRQRVPVHLAPHDHPHDLLARVIERTDKCYDDRARTVGADSICAMATAYVVVLDALG